MLPLLLLLLLSLQFLLLMLLLSGLLLLLVLVLLVSFLAGGVGRGGSLPPSDAHHTKKVLPAFGLVRLHRENRMPCHRLDQSAPCQSAARIGKLTD